MPHFFTKSMRNIILLLTLSALAACAGLGRTQEDVVCPSVRVIKDTDVLTRFKPGPGRDITDIELQAELVRAAGVCEAYDDHADVFLNIDIQALQGTANQSSNQVVDLIIGIVGPDGELIAPAPIGHRKLPLNLTFPSNQSQIVYKEVIRVDVPFSEEQSPDDFIIYVSFGLSKEEYKYNQEN
ncbi:hypothetical protein [Curvivirga sp.]|uniref:hypothetical protein n=1 Tax=Curvivirga sp. TaxID=2856848 RepID=UPI003B5D037D